MIRKLSVLVALAMLVAACSSGESSDTTPPETLTTTSQAPTTTTTVPPTTTTEAPDDGFPVTIDAPNGSVTIDERPERVVSISPSSTEVLFAVGAGDQVVAVDDQSNYPPEAPTTDLSGFTPNIEAIAAFEPDLVFLSFDPGDIIAGLEAIGIPVILHGAPFTVAEAYGQWEQVGVATGNIAGAAAVVADVTQRIEAAYTELPEGTDELSYYWELDPTYFSVTSSTFIGDLLSGAEMTNIADEADPDGFGFPQLTSEYIVASDPSLIALADTKCCGQTAETLAERPGWDTMTAVQSGTILELDDDIASRWGPRIADLVETVGAGIAELAMANA